MASYMSVEDAGAVGGIEDEEGADAGVATSVCLGVLGFSSGVCLVVVFIGFGAVEVNAC